MEDPSLLDLLQLGLCRCMAFQAPSTCKETVGDNLNELCIDLRICRLLLNRVNLLHP